MNRFLTSTNDQGCLLMLTAGCLILGLICSYSLPWGGVWYDCLNNGKMLISGLAPPLPAYPMWGYCFLAALTGRAVIVLQASLAFLFILLCHLRCQRLTLGSLKTHPPLSVLLILLIPWFFLVTSSLTNSIASILICVGTWCLYKGVTNKSLPLLILAGTSLGLGFNFRSEVLILACFYFVALSAHVFRTDGDLVSKVKHLVSFAGVVVIFTIPWLAYTKLTVGHSLFHSTNRGATAYLGLGALPNNPWCIVHDDSYVAKIARDNNLETPWGYDGDQFFTNRFIEAIRIYPMSFLHRILTGWRLMFMQGLFFPDFRQLLSNDQRDYIPYGYLNEKLKEALYLKVNEEKLRRYESNGMGFRQVALTHWVGLVSEYCVRGLFALVFLSVVCALLFRVNRRCPLDLCITLPLVCVAFNLVVAGFVQTLPAHTTQTWPVLVIFLMCADCNDRPK